MFEKIKAKLNKDKIQKERAKVAKEIESGQRPRGRMPEAEAGIVEGGFGNGAIIGHTELMAKHFIRDNGGEYKRTVRSLKLFGLTLLNIKRRFSEIVEDRRVVYDRVVTDAFVNDIVDALQGSAGPYGTFDDYKYHDSGTGTGNEAAGDTALGTPCGESRDTGTQTEGASANIYKSVATHTYAGSFAITEHGLFNASTGGTLMDRTKFTAINVVATDQIEFTFQITFTSGG